MTLPDTKGHFGIFGGRYVPETLIHALDQLNHEYRRLIKDKKFKSELKELLETYAGRPTALYEARNLSNHFGRARIFLKREDLCHTGAHKINNTLGQGLLAKKLGKKRIVAETGAGQHGVATATAARVFNLECVVYMGEEDIRRQALNVYKMNLLGAKVIPVYSGSRTLKDATNEAIRDWVAHVETTHYLLGSVVGPHPYPMMVRNFQSVIGIETFRQFSRLQVGAYGRTSLPNYLLACVGGGSNAIGFFYPFLKKKQVRMIGVEAGGEGLASGRHAASLTRGTVGILHGMKSYLLQNGDGQVQVAHSISAGLDYPSVGPEHSYLKDTKRVQYETVTDREALQGFQLLTEMEGIMPALEPAHAVGFLNRFMKRTRRGESLIVCLSGRGDKDINVVKQLLSS